MYFSQYSLIVELLDHEASLVPLVCSLLCQEKLKQCETKRAGSLNADLAFLLKQYSAQEISVRELHVRAADVVRDVDTCAHNANIPQ